MPQGFIGAEVKGTIEAKKKMEQVARDLHGGEFVDGMHQSLLLVTRDARILAPVSDGLLRSSITPDVETRGRDVIGRVGTNKIYGPFMELGTGIFAGRPRVRMPPPAALEGWAKKHGTTGYIVARAIWKAGGLRPRRFLAKALERNEKAIQELLGKVVAKIVHK